MVENRLIIAVCPRSTPRVQVPPGSQARSIDASRQSLNDILNPGEWMVNTLGLDYRIPLPARQRWTRLRSSAVRMESPKSRYGREGYRPTHLTV